MTKRQHKENHFTSSELVRDIVIGMSDGLTVPFALAAGLTGAVTASHLIIAAGFAEIAAGSISMGLGGFLAAKGDQEHYYRERKIESQEVIDQPEVEAQEVRDILGKYGLATKQVEPILVAFKNNPKAWVDFMMTNELELKEPHPKRALNSALTIASSYTIGGLVPLSAYLFVSDAQQAVVLSAAITLVALFTFGFFKARVAGAQAWKSAWQTVLIGGLAAGAAFLLARIV